MDVLYSLTVRIPYPTRTPRATPSVNGFAELVHASGPLLVFANKTPSDALCFIYHNVLRNSIINMLT